MGDSADIAYSWMSSHRMGATLTCLALGRLRVQFSMLGLVQVYNRLPARIVEANGCVSSFQAALQEVLAQRAAAGCCDWRCTFSPQVPMHRHPLVQVA